MRTFKQELVALFGQPAAENPTGAMVEAAFGHHGLDWRYLTIEVAPRDLEAAVRGARAMGFRGFHCTIPHKVAVVEHLDATGESAALIGAVNCVVRRDAMLVGENTDGRGFVDALRRRLDPAGASVVLLGAGGAARAIAVELVLAGAGRIAVANRTAERARELLERVERVAADRGSGMRTRLLPWSAAIALPEADVVVNATSIGLHPDGAARVPVDRASFSPAMLVADVIPNPPRTALLAEAEKAGCPTLDGLEMLVEQGALSIRYWTGIEPERAVMRDALARVFGGG